MAESSDSNRGSEMEAVNKKVEDLNQKMDDLMALLKESMAQKSTEIEKRKSVELGAHEKGMALPSEMPNSLIKADSIEENQHIVVKGKAKVQAGQEFLEWDYAQEHEQVISKAVGSCVGRYAEEERLEKIVRSLQEELRALKREKSQGCRDIARVGVSLKPGRGNLQDKRIKEVSTIQIPPPYQTQSSPIHSSYSLPYPHIPNPWRPMFQSKENPKSHRQPKGNRSYMNACRRPYVQGKSHPTSSRSNMQSTSNTLVRPMPPGHNNLKFQKEDRPFPNFKMTKQELLDTLLKCQTITLSPGREWKPPYPHWYKPSENCSFHTGAVGHSLDTCPAFKKAVWDLLDRNVITLELQLTPSPLEKPLPNCVEDHPE